MFNHILVIGWMFMAGWVPFDDNGFTKYNNQFYSDYKNSTHIDMEFNALFIDHINVRGGIESWQYPVAIDDWTPYKIKFNIGMDLSLFEFNKKEFNVYLSVDRYCSHPVNLWNNTAGCVNNAYCEVSIKFKGTADIF